MTWPAHHIRYSLADYLALEASSNVKHEFLDGQIYGMAGGTPEHAAITSRCLGRAVCADSRESLPRARR